MSRARDIQAQGPFRADQLSAGDPYELSRGHVVECLPTGARGGKANLLGGAVLASDPAVEAAGVDTGFSPNPSTMRAPDVAVGAIPDEPGWVPGVPALAVEYADRGQNETELAEKIDELLGLGTRFVWVVRLAPPPLRQATAAPQSAPVPYVEVHEAGEPIRVYGIEETLTAPGVLERPVPVRALIERDAGLDATLANLLARRGYESLDAVRHEGHAEGRAAMLLELLEARFGALEEALVQRVRSGSVEQLRTWAKLLPSIEAPTEIFE
ncbi:MAG: Uma2 family endonuclease [Polyangiaceae bacterium]|nr:Uma2 family endonuclease [Polyangiaceae bacterium]